jgi:leader peptidase (prepilin peptidase)/N-methyltransferase
VLTLVIILGLLFGSFFSVVKTRIANPKEIALGRSKCPKCHYALGVFDLIPILSFVFLRGKCRYCKKPISVIYPIYEIISALLALLVYYRFGFSITSFLCFLSLGFFAVGAILDSEEQEVELYLILIGMGLALTFAILRDHSIVGLKNILFGFVSAGLLPFLLYAISKERWMGLGDTFFAAWAGAIVLFPGSVLVVFLSFFLGALYGIIIKNLNKSSDSHVAFAPFILLSAIIVLAYGDSLVSWYLKILGF